MWITDLSWFTLLLLINNCGGQIIQLCELSHNTNGGQIILNLDESRGNEITQRTNPPDLPIQGDPQSDISLSLDEDGKKYFVINGKHLMLVSPIDRDYSALSTIRFKVKCSSNDGNTERDFPVLVTINDINDNKPEFTDLPYNTEVQELASVGTSIFRVTATDPDYSSNGQVEYSVIRGDGSSTDGYGYFSITLPHQGVVTVNKSLDYEKTNVYYVTIMARDSARDSEKLSSTVTLTVNVLDVDDQGPTFEYEGCNRLENSCLNPEYFAMVTSGRLSGVLDISPDKIRAHDTDSLNDRIIYSFQSGEPENFANYFAIDPRTGVVKQLKAVNRNMARSYKMIIKAEEATEKKRFATATLTVMIEAVDLSSPVINLSGREGYVMENSPVGTTVSKTVRGNDAIHLSVSDADLGPNDGKPRYEFELTTDAFRVNNDGNLVVNRTDLDRDPPNPDKYRFQIVAREVGSTASSAPVTMVVHLMDENDNAPVLPILSPVTVEAGEGRRRLKTIKAEDKDSGENSEITYSIKHVSSNGRNKFDIDSVTGDLDVVGRVEAEERYSVNVQAKDAGGLTSSGILEVMVLPGPNKRPPRFSSSVYDAQVSEGASRGSVVLKLQATDPEGDRVFYRIVRGNDMGHFRLDDETGTLLVDSKLDREEISRYTLDVRAEDEGGLFSLAQVHIRVEDINDKNPVFHDLPIAFRVSEGEEAKSYVGRVKATDDDANENAVIYYSVPRDSDFEIDTMTGEIRTKVRLDFEKKPVHYLVVTARDGAEDPRIATATVTVLVSDREDEPPLFRQTFYEVNIQENKPDKHVVQVKAEDTDSRKSITYVIKSGDHRHRFTIDRRTGDIFTTNHGLDYEEEEQYKLIVGTEENSGNGPGDTAMVVINVQDSNDIPPVFSSPPSPRRLRDNVPVGTKVAQLTAYDADRSSPGNKVMYEISGLYKEPDYFEIDNRGNIFVKKDLSLEMDSEYRIQVKAYDLGSPSLTATATVTVFVDHIATRPPESRVGFADQEYSVEIAEDSPENLLVKRLTLINKPNRDIQIRCEFTDDNDRFTTDLFYIRESDDRDCELRLRQPLLDYEERRDYIISVRIQTLSAFLNPAKDEARVIVRVLDINDNEPEFIFSAPYNKYSRSQYYAAVSRDAEISTSVATVQARDADAGPYGNLEYSILPESDPDRIFSIDRTTGTIYNEKTLVDVPTDHLPFRLMVQVEDSPKARMKKYASVHVVVNLIDEPNRLVLVITDAPPDEVKYKKEEIIATIQDQADLIVGVEKIEARKYLTANNTIDSYSNGTDVWFYLVDPQTSKILSISDQNVDSSIRSEDASKDITYYLSSNLGVTATEIRPPLVVVHTAPAQPVRPADEWEVLAVALIVLACIILTLGIIGIVYICFLWSRYKMYKDRPKQPLVVPRYEPVLMEPSLKEYETQILQMSVPIDENDSMNDFQLDFSQHRNHAFNLDNVAYITRDEAQRSPVSSGGTFSETATTMRASSVADRSSSDRTARLGDSDRSHHHPQLRPPRNFSNHLMEFVEDDPTTNNPLYERSDDGGGPLSISTTNDNVMFREKKDFSNVGGFSYMNDRSPVETTTEL